jgi:hypothetical protein
VSNQPQTELSPDGYQPPPPPAGTNAYARPALIFGILPLPPVGLVLGTLGVIRAGRTGAGKAMSWIGIALSVLWIIAGAVAFAVWPAAGTPTPTATGPDAGCYAVETNLPAKSSELEAAKDEASRTTAIQSLIDELKADEQKTKIPAARTAMENFRHDLESLQAGLQSGNVDPTIVAKLTDDGAAVDTACR